MNFLNTRNKQTGATLIEALTALFVFAVGALGVAALQTTAMVRGDDTRQRSIAIWKAQELVDRIKATKSIDDPDGLIAEFIAAIDNDNSDGGIGELNAADEYQCPAVAPTRCDDQLGTNASACGEADVIAADIWSVICDPNSGAAPRGDAVVGSVGLRNLEIALEANGGEFRLYLEWLNRTSNNNRDTDGVDTGLQNSDGSARNVVTNLCGEDENIDSRLDAYCLRFQ